MNNYTIRVYVPESTGTATLSRADIINSKFLTNEQKQLLLDKLGYDSIEYKGDQYFKVAEAKKVEVTESKLYWNPKKNKYIEVEDKQFAGYVTDINSTTAVVKENTKYKFW